MRDHPRTRGVYYASSCRGDASRGSSPHTRGLLISVISVSVRSGIIPAHAGFTHLSSSSAGAVWDHPRTRGVYTARSRTVVGTWGSSPHTRGLRDSRSGPRFLSGIIPAHAGFTPGGADAHAGPRDHPRTRGVYGVVGGAAQLVGGSSPHTRGLPVTLTQGHVSPGIIPAHAGFTTARRRRRPGRRDHPRTRGVYCLILSVWLPAPGSSPHTRGLRATLRCWGVM